MNLPSQSRPLDYAGANTGRTRRPTAFWIVPVDWTASLFAGACAASMLWAARLPVTNLIPGLLGLLAGIGASIALLLSARLHILLWIRRRKQPTEPTRNWRLFIFALMLLAMTWALLEAQVPRWLMFQLNRSGMDRWVQQTLKLPGQPPVSAPIGSYDAYNIERIPGGFRFFVSGAGFFRRGGGFAYSPGAPPIPCGAPQDDYTPAAGGWYFREYDGG
jgi:hypothetical protein